MKSDVRVIKRRVKIGFKGRAENVDEGIANPLYATECRNFTIEDGVLRADIGIESASGYFEYPSRKRHVYKKFYSDQAVRKVFLYRHSSQNAFREDRLVAVLEDGSVWYTNVFYENNWQQIESLCLIGDVEAVNYNYKGEDILLLTSDEDGLTMIKGDIALVCGEAPKFTSIAIHNERVFGCMNGTKNQVWYSDDFAPDNWNISATEAGYINFADECGEAIKVLSFAGYLYVFREYGVFRLTAYGDQNEFLLKKVFTDTGRIYKDSIVPCGDKILFFAQDGLFAFDGYTATKIGRNIPKLETLNGICASYLDGCYYFACRLLEDEGTGNNAIVKFDIDKRSVQVLDGVNVKWLFSVKTHNGSDVLCVFADGNKNKIGMLSDSGSVLDVNTKKVYKSPYGIMSEPNVKILRDVCITTKYPLTLAIIIDDTRHAFELAGSEKQQKIVVEKCGTEFAFELESEEKSAYVLPIEANFEIMRG